jgi:HSP20 family protein
VAVKGDQAHASYRNGVLKVELPKLTPGRPNVTQITVS